MDPLDAILKAGDLVAVLGRDVRVRLIDISGSGCLLESDCRLAEGTTGSLRVTIEGRDYEDDVRIMRCQNYEGTGGGFHLGAEFLWTTNPREHSLRRVLATIQAGALLPGRFEATERM
ncbi:MAG: PilZ domain-containing protein [Acidobacteria bacterium]|nr:PilZ domain-containing protein [Acidobacteriota bacterium]